MESENFVVIKGWMCNELNLKGNELLVFALIYGFSQDGKSKFCGGRRYIAKTFNISLPTVDSALQGLLDKAYIIRISSNDYINTDNYYYNAEVVKKLYCSGKETLPEGGKETLLNNNSKRGNIVKRALIGNPIKDIPKNQAPEIDTFVKLYNELCPNLPKCIKHTDNRDKAISKIVKKYSLEDIRTVFTKANDSEFLTGKNDRGWTASIDFILRDDKFVSILEGKYDGKQRTNVSSEEPLTEDRRANKKKFWEDVKNGKAEKF